MLPAHLCYKTREEKRTDVNFVTQIIIDGVNNLYDKAILITADSDITPAVEAIKRRDLRKYFVYILPKKDK
ncbi:MAG: NYN domain-containing protein [Candidatus Peribacteria bacterium]|nr:NYN domain-containing protein [Candidatus Peribacteria bacterium]